MLCRRADVERGDLVDVVCEQLPAQILHAPESSRGHRHAAPFAALTIEHSPNEDDTGSAPREAGPAD